jgi:hypothetical protein
MAFFNWSRKKEEVEQPKQVEKNDVPKVVDYFNIKETEFGFARLVNIRRYRGNGISALLMINPQYMFPTQSQLMYGQYAGFSPTMNSYGEGLLIVDDVPSKISNISVEINILDKSNDYRDYQRYNTYNENSYFGDIHIHASDRYNTCLLSYDRQAFANAVDGMVTQTKQSFLTDNKINFRLKVNSDINISNENELRYQVSRITSEVKSSIEEQFRKEIVKSKLIEVKDKFFQQLSQDVMTDIFQHIIDLIPESKLVIGNESIRFHVPIVGKNTHKDLRVSFVFDDKVSNIFYELGESSKRILGYCKNSYCDISFSSDGIVVKISPQLENYKNPTPTPREYLNERQDSGASYYADRDRYINSGIRVRNPYTDWNLQ